MRRGLAGDVQSAALRLPDKLHALLRGDMTHMIAAAGLCDKLQIARDLPPFGFAADAAVSVLPGIFAVVDIAAVQQTVVLAMGDDQFAEISGAAHGLQHDLIGLYAAAVVGKARDIGRHGLHV